MRLVFVATGDIALPSFRFLLEQGPRPLALVTQPDKPVGRHQKLAAPAIKEVAMAAGVAVLQPEKIGDAADELAALDPEILVVMAYGQLLRKNILTLPSRCIINLHASILPKYRGAACIQAAIDAGDTESGVTAMHVVRELDAGDIIHVRRVALAQDETGGSLHDRLALVGADVLADTLRMFAEGNAPRIPQKPELVSYVPKLSRDDGRLDWTMPAVALERRIRAYDPWPGTFTLAMVGGVERRVKIMPPTQVIKNVGIEPGAISVDGGRLMVGCGEDALEIATVQPEGGKRMTAADYLRGVRPESFR